MTGHNPLFIIPPLVSLFAGTFLSTIAVFKGRFRAENILFALTCMLATILSIVFISHHLVDDDAVIVAIDRWVHSFYVFILPVSLWLFFKILRVMNRPILAAAFIISIILAPLTHTEWYFEGQYTFSWGHIARSGILFSIFGSVCFIALLYCFYLSIKRLRVENDLRERLNIRYILITIAVTAVLLLCNVPAMFGFNIYPMGNFMFIPLGIMAYGILRYGLMDVKTIVHRTIFWFILSALILVPNTLFFFVMKPYIPTMSLHWFLLAVMLWLFANGLYYSLMQPRIDQWFNRRKYNLIDEESRFIEYLASLRNIGELVNYFRAMIEKNLAFGSVRVFVIGDEGETLVSMDGAVMDLSPGVLLCLEAGTGRFIGGMSRGDSYAEEKALEALLREHGAESLLPILRNGELVALALLSPRLNGKNLSGAEESFLQNVASSMAIALSNSMLFQNVTDLKNNLEKIVEERTATIEQQKKQLEHEIELANQIQLVLLPHNIPRLESLGIAYKWVPVRGVSGDFVDIHYRPGFGDIGFFICDVSGHGVPAALLASMVKMSLNAWGGFIREPARGLLEIHDLLSGKLKDNFITACMCCLDMERGELIAASAGHPPIVIARRKKLRVVNLRGKFISDLVEPVYRSRVIPLEPGDRIILYTDGLTEFRNEAGEMLGEDALYKIIMRNLSLGPREFVEVVYDEILAMTGCDSLEDDFTLMVVDFRG